MIAREELNRGTTKPRSIVDLFEANVAARSAHICSKYKRDGRWLDMTWADAGRRARDLSDGLASLGVVKGDRVSIIGETTPEWILADLGIMGAAAVTVPIYQSNKPAECQYILDNAGVKLIFCDDAQVAKIREVRDQLPGLQKIIRISGQPRDDFETTVADLEKAGAAWRANNPNAHAARLASLSLEDSASFIYTSGTTGNPKGVVLTHGNWVYCAEACYEIGITGPEDVTLMFLPMAHSFAKIVMAAWMKVGGVGAFVESLDKIIQNAGEVKPTVMPSVPRIFEKAFNAVVAKGLATPGLKGKLFKFAMEGLDDFVAARERGNQNGGGWKLLVGQKLVFPKVGEQMKHLFGGRMRLFISGGAPLSPKIAWFFKLVGFEVCEGYGLTETSAASFVNRAGKVKIGTVGQPYPGTDVKIAPDGEILIKGPCVMKEYYRNPEATAEVLKDGWLYTGDIGELDSENYLKITDRKKDIIVTAGGKNVAPQNLENDLKTDPMISQVMVHGDKRKFLSALITVNEENLAKWAQDGGMKFSGSPQQDPRVRARVQQAVDALNAKQASYAQIKKFAILPKDLTQEAGELTPTLKVKRKFCSQKYKDILDGFYVE